MRARNQGSSYSEKLKDPRWQKKRLEVLERDGWKCRLCGEEEKTLHVHHLVYMKGFEPWEVPSGLLLTVCEECHKGDREDPEEWTTLEYHLRQLGTLLECCWEAGIDLLSLVQEINDIKKPTVNSFASGIKVTCKWQKFPPQSMWYRKERKS
jgi:hypothetical protein